MRTRGVKWFHERQPSSPDSFCTQWRFSPHKAVQPGFVFPVLIRDDDYFVGLSLIFSGGIVIAYSTYRDRVVQGKSEKHGHPE